MTTTTIQSDKTAYVAVLHKASAELAALTKEEEALLARGPAIRSELEALTSRADARAVELATAQQTVGSLKSALQAQQTRADLAEGTSLHAEAKAPLTAQKKHLAQAERQLQEIAIRCAQEEAVNNQRRAVLNAEYEQTNQRLTEIREKILALSAAKAEAHHELGECEYRDIMAQVAIAQATIASKERELAEAKQTLKDIVHDGTKRLAQWGNRQYEIWSLLPYQDAYMRVIQADIDFIDTVLQERNSISRVIPLKRADNQQRWMERLATPYEMLRNVTTGQERDCKLLDGRKKELEAMRDTFKAEHNGIPAEYLVSARDLLA